MDTLVIPASPTPEFLDAAIKGIKGRFLAIDYDQRTEKRLVTRSFVYRGKGRQVTVAVRLQPKVMARLLKAMKTTPTVQVTQPHTSPYSGSFRSHEQQKALYDAYKAGTGHLAAPPYSSAHELGVAIDTYYPTERERAALLDVGFFDLLPQDPPHFAFGRRM